MEDCLDIVIAVECTFIVLCRKLYEETEHDEVGKYVNMFAGHITTSISIVYDQDQDDVW